MFRRGGPANDGIMTGIEDREKLSLGTRDPKVIGQSARDYIEQFEPLLREFTPKTRLPLGQVGFALASGVDPLQALGAGYSQFVKADDAREAAIRRSAASMGLGQALKDATPSKNVLKNRRVAIANLKAEIIRNERKSYDENDIALETARLNKLDETGKGVNLQRLIVGREKELRNDPLEDYDFKQAQRQANFEYVTGPKIEQETGKTVQGSIEFDDDENTYDTDGKQPGIYYDPFRNTYVEITSELEVIINPPEILNVLK
tara:strand:- start:330 stop:1112 length:783 start_codon:yes stop_codon:yes gene_type:complete